jgi:hypothetical protein
MKIKLTNKKTGEFEIIEVIDFGNNYIIQKAGLGIMTTTYNTDEHLIEKYEEEVI